jgi:hypothetical protein
LKSRKGGITAERLIRRLFGEKLYRYKLKMPHKFPPTIYKQRNISLNAGRFAEIVHELYIFSNAANMMSLCMAACEVSGQWVCENEQG